ncbi:hypothetical protein N8584_01290 [bacterium]|nr:hypothetical protein [bacterium]
MPTGHRVGFFHFFSRGQVVVEPLVIGQTGVFYVKYAVGVRSRASCWALDRWGKLSGGIPGARGCGRVTALCRRIPTAATFIRTGTTRNRPAGRRKRDN